MIESVFSYLKHICIECLLFIYLFFFVLRVFFLVFTHYLLRERSRSRSKDAGSPKREEERRERESKSRSRSRSRSGSRERSASRDRSRSASPRQNGDAQDRASTDRSPRSGE